MVDLIEDPRGLVVPGLRGAIRLPLLDSAIRDSFQLPLLRNGEGELFFTATTVCWDESDSKQSERTRGRED